MTSSNAILKFLDFLKEFIIEDASFVACDPTFTEVKAFINKPEIPPPAIAPAK